MKKLGNNLNTINDNNHNEESQHNYLGSNIDNYKYWQYNTILLYNVIMIYTCEWPSLFIEWLPKVHKNDEEYAYQDLILGTYTTEKNNYILILEVTLPSEEFSYSSFYYEKINDYRHNFCNDTSKNFRIKNKIYHESEINKISCYPENADIVACFCSDGNINIFNINDYYNKDNENEIKNDNILTFDKTLKGHLYQGWGLEWDDKNNYISSCGDDSYLCIWDMNTSDKIMHPIVKYFNHNIPLQDCCWNDNNVLSVSENGHINIYDIRNKSVVNSICATNCTLNSIDVNPHNKNIFATAGTNKEIDLWDIRFTNKSLHRIISQKETIIKLKWDKFQPGILSSSTSDKFIYFFDTNKIGIEQTYEDSQDGPPELIFIHGGHSSNILDYSLNNSYSMMISSISEDNTLHIWQPSKQAYEDASDTYDDTEVE
ncbi:chromatin assembly factor 1 P55 subunit, putative [Plasmodium sp. DRC-Itaito]|nr:chromatin assembly factor 1 P55 subunit, putative [Plasmodium sp. DRC-Itaito]